MDPLSQAFDSSIGQFSSSTDQPGSEANTYWQLDTSNLVTYNQLSECYASDPGNLELAELLTNWHMGELYSYFIGEYLYKYSYPFVHMNIIFSKFCIFTIFYIRTTPVHRNSETHVKRNGSNFVPKY